MENNEIQKFDPATLMQGVKDRIKATFVSLIPDDQWEQMVKKEVDGFFELKKREYYRKEYTSDFELLVQEELTKECKRRLTEYMSSPQFINTWTNNGQPVATESVKKMIVDNSGVILSNMFSGMFNQILVDISQRMRNNQY